MPNWKLVTSVAASNKAVHKLLCLDRPVVGLAHKGVNKGVDGTITLIAVSTFDGYVYLFDIKTCPDIMLLGGLIRLLQSVEVVKVVHDCSFVSVLLHKLYDITLKNYFDTQIAYSVIMESRGLTRRKISLQSLCDKYYINVYRPPPDIQRKMNNDINFWGLRPMTKVMSNTAAAEVLPLVPYLYEELCGQLMPDTFEWFDSLSEENRMSKITEKTIEKRRDQRRRKDFIDHIYEYPVTRLSEEQKLLVKNTVPETHQFVS